jgi:hypothetical protein
MPGRRQDHSSTLTRITPRPTPTIGAAQTPKRNAALRRLGQDAVAVAGDELVQNLQVGFSRAQLRADHRAHIRTQSRRRISHIFALAHRTQQLEADAAHAVVEGIGARQWRHEQEYAAHEHQNPM